ncbi:Uncharacterized protein YqgQ [Amphibacillus marinus]|uniref:Uncharacterized protein YqgQ n=1 Tax=Amphibacillus marinus TaxID=872970 RepID=A0A1H8HES9_9BACI|nr:YqgQ family protein [Amphibacillus marinus]SEN54771.1 Uncharacterized protein YqgQ [Amphibacillus marinus]
MKTFYDIRRFLHRYGVYIYLGNQEAEIELSLIELKALYQEGIVATDDYLRALETLNQLRCQK